MEKFLNFMQDRYGFDKLGQYLIIASIVLSIISRLFWLRSLNWISTILIVIFIYRFLSKKEFARMRENQIFLSFLEKLKTFFQRDTTKYDYYKCPVCKTNFQKPKNQVSGYTTKVICPKCKNEF